MKWMISIVSLVAGSLLFASGTKNILGAENGILARDTTEGKIEPARYDRSKIENRNIYSFEDLELIINQNKITQFILGRSKDDRLIEAFYFPGRSSQRALIIGGMHGSELSSVEVAYRLVNELLEGEKPYYSVVVVPTLFPDNAARAIKAPHEIGSPANIGRYTHTSAVDPNRQMPSPGRAFDDHLKIDHVGREIERENQFLLRLIQMFRPTRIANLHAIRNTNYGGVYADPRTDHNGLALGYDSDSTLAVQMAFYIHERGGNVAGNHLDSRPSALYYKDPEPAKAGTFQKRNMTGSTLKANRGSGVSLGTWASTAIVDKKDPANSRNAMRILTIEYPGYKRPTDYTSKDEQMWQHKQVEAYASALSKIFLENYLEEKA